MARSYQTNVVLCKLYYLVRSPIELIIGLALFARLSVNGGCWLYSDSEYRKVTLSPSAGDRYGSFAVVSGFRIHPQIEVDFAVFHPDLSPTQPLAVVECDGHEFHERTREQASRDRWRDRMIQYQGVPVLRFTGTDVVHGSAEFAQEVVEFIGKRYFEASLGF
jgi:very-short-patch-repair endonuclease